MLACRVLMMMTLLMVVVVAAKVIVMVVAAMMLCIPRGFLEWLSTVVVVAVATAHTAGAGDAVGGRISQQVNTSPGTTNCCSNNTNTTATCFPETTIPTTARADCGRSIKGCQRGSRSSRR